MAIHHMLELLEQHAGQMYETDADWTNDCKETWDESMRLIAEAVASVGDFELRSTSIGSQKGVSGGKGWKIREEGYFFLILNESPKDLYDCISVVMTPKEIRLEMQCAETKVKDSIRKLCQERVIAVQLHFGNKPYSIGRREPAEADDEQYLEEIKRGMAKLLEQWRDVYRMGWDTPQKLNREEMRQKFKEWMMSPEGNVPSASNYLTYLNYYVKHCSLSKKCDVFLARTLPALQSLCEILESDENWQQWRTLNEKNVSNAHSALKKYEYFLGESNMLMSNSEALKSSSEASKNYKLDALNTILYGPPGTGKTYNTKRYAVSTCGGNMDKVNDEYKRLVQEGRIKFVTFHQTYGYEEFIQGISAKTKNDNVEYFVKEGVFVQFCEAAREKTEPYVFIIDEINRGNISKIFGELITLIEDTKREGMDDEQSAVLPQPYTDGDGNMTYKTFSVPKNVYLLGTMNTADRSIAMLDTALRRRFAFVEMMPDASLLKDIKVGDVAVNDMLNDINARIEFLFDREHTIGHAFFTSLLKAENRTEAHLKEIFRNKVIPLLQEYFYDDYGKIQQVLGKSFVKNIVAPSSLNISDAEKRYMINNHEKWIFKECVEKEKKQESVE